MFCVGIAHRDIKPGNILIHKEKEDSHTQLKLADFGLADYITGPTCYTRRVGTIAYSAPEVLKGSFGPAADVYSAAAVLYSLLTGRPPFCGDTGKLSFMSSNLLFVPNRSTCRYIQRQLRGAEAYVQGYLVVYHALHPHTAQFCINAAV